MKFIPMHDLETSRLRLRQVRLFDLPEYHRLLTGDPAVARWMLWDASSDPARAEAAIRRILAGYQDGTRYHWAIARKDTDAFLGTIALVGLDPEGNTGSFAYMLGREYWGRGYGSEALGAVLRFAFEELELDAIQADHFAENPASGAAMARAGLRPTGILPGKYEKNGIRHDAVQYAITKEEYEKGVKNPMAEYNREKDISLLEVYDVETGERTLLKEFPYLIEAPNWSRDGKFLVYNSRGRIYKYILETGAVEEIYTGIATACNNDHVLSFDGQGLAVSHGPAGWDSRVYTLPLEGGEAKLVTENAPSFLHGWSPDGKTLVYCAFRPNGDGGDIWAIDVQGGQEWQLTDAPGLNDGPEYDPTGETIWFNSVRTGLMQAWKMKADGSQQTQMTFDEGWNTWFPHISPDGKLVSMVCYKKGDLEPGEHLPHKHVELRVMNADGSDLRTVARLFGGQGTINVNSWSPDSKRFAFVSYRLNIE